MQGARQKRIIAIVLRLSPLLVAIALIAWHEWPKSLGLYRPVDLKALGAFDLDQANGKATDIPKKWRDLDGKKVKLDGFMYSNSSSASALTDFQFVYTFSSNHGRPPQVQERVFAHAIPPVTFYDTWVEIRGTLHVTITRDASGDIISLYTIDVDGIADPNSAMDTRTPAQRSLDILQESAIPFAIILLIIFAGRELILLIRRFPNRAFRRHNLCAACGYDIRASPERCPECGTPTGREPISRAVPMDVAEWEG